jgi:hypothetical protein
MVKSIPYEKEIDFKIVEATRYQESCHVYYLLDSFLKENGLGSIVAIERSLKKAGSGAEEIDALIHFNDKEYCVLELKTSIRDKDDIEKTFEQIKARDTDFLVDGNPIKINSQILLCHEDNIVEVINVYAELVAKKHLLLSKPIIFLVWRVGEDTGHIENYYIKYHSGEESNSLIKKIKDNPIKKHLSQTILKSEQERFYFTNIKPPLPYMYFRFKFYVSQTIRSLLLKPNRQEIINLGLQENIIKDFKEKLGNQLVAPRSTWIKDTIIFFEKQKWLLRKEDCSIDVHTKKFRSFSSDEFRKFSEKVYREELLKNKREERRREKIEEKERKRLKKLGEGQRTLLPLFP